MPPALRVECSLILHSYRRLNTGGNTISASLSQVPFGLVAIGIGIAVAFDIDTDSDSDTDSDTDSECACLLYDDKNLTLQVNPPPFIHHRFTNHQPRTQNFKLCFTFSEPNRRFGQASVFASAIHPSSFPKLSTQNSELRTQNSFLPFPEAVAYHKKYSINVRMKRTIPFVILSGP
jgi:hypothetical protein